MRKLTLIVVLSLLMLISAILLATPKPKLAVMEIDSDSQKLSKQAIDKATRYLRSRIEVAGKYIVIDKARQDTALTSQMQQESYGVCIDESCQIELGKALAADTILRSKVTEFGTQCMLTATLVNLEKQAATGGAEAAFDCTVDGLRLAIDTVVAQLTGRTTQTAEATSPAPKPKENSAGMSYDELMQRAQKLKAEQAAIEAARQKRLEKLEADWKKVQDVARTDLPKAERIAFVQQFLASYPSDNPHKDEAQRLVKALQSDQPITIAGGEVWVDPDSELMWQTTPETYNKWDEARRYCLNLDLGGYDDWRLPTILELRSLIRGCKRTEKHGLCNMGKGCKKEWCRFNACNGCDINGGPGADGYYWPQELPKQPDGLDSMYWSSTFIEGRLYRRGSSKVIYEPAIAIVVDFLTASVRRRQAEYNNFPFRCVRETD